MILREIKNMYINNFTKIEYLGSTGTQWIDTDFRPDSMTTSFELDISFEGRFVYNWTGKTFIKTSATESRTQGFAVNFGGQDSQSNTIFLWFGKSWIAGTESCTLEPVALTRDIFRYSQGTVSYNGKSVNVDNSPYPRVAGRREGTMQILKGFNCYNARLYGVKIWDNSSLVRDFIPVRIGSTGYMYDKVSNQLFGNSGTGNFVLGPDVNIGGFKQIYQNKLIEGEDYETYDWLKADIPISTIMMRLPINSKSFEFRRNWIQLANSWYFSTLNSTNASYGYFITDNGDGNDRHPRIWDDTNKRTIFTSSINVGLGVHTISANDNGVTISSTVNTASLPRYGNTQYIIVFNNSSNVNKNTIHLTSSIEVDGVTRYVPCQLLHSIPRNLDAQCKERVAGECGMIDLISGKFYGNVANSGTFTVENDSNE